MAMIPAFHILQWDLVCDMDYVSDLVTTLQGVGLLIGAAVFGQMSDLQGRKRSWFTANLIMLLGGLNTFQYVQRNLKYKPVLIKRYPGSRAEYAGAWSDGSIYIVKFWMPTPVQLSSFLPPA